MSESCCNTHGAGEHTHDSSSGAAPAGTDRTVRPARPEDAEAIGAIQRAALESHIEAVLNAAQAAESMSDVIAALPDARAFQEHWAQTLTAPAPEGCHTLVAIHGQSVGGFICAIPGEELPEIPDKRPAIPAGTEIVALEVNAHFQRSGHGSRLLNALAETCGAPNLRIWVGAEDEARVRFLQSAGFTPSGLRRQLQMPGAVADEHLWWTSLA
ncbi:GNAT family N-acetyltransferase [Schaalia sp. Marseille-Q2122]|uniref:GNAT family N-acetyltransferase n=1 Tax=Schaalia sp. Marseille-Q2122 TaxID=2736604 RepID=UPI0015890365|nr:GNAT family N-acetyltransferase [Schaalia sp. Marseille-Q2122]